MSRGMRTAVAALATAGLIAAPPAPAAQPAGVRCRNVSYDRDAGYYVYRSTMIRAVRVRCALARRVARVNATRVRGARARRTYSYEGFFCRGRRLAARTVAFRCTRERSVITFHWTIR